jgi:predicted GNAT superfamily acetyltransferase
MSEVRIFSTEEELHERITVMNYDEAVVAELACVDDAGTVFLTAATDQGDLIGISYYLTNAEGYMYHYGAEATEEDTTDYRTLMDWKPKFPVRAIGARP